MGKGEIAALTAAALWTGSSMLYTRIALTAWQINFSKTVMASCLVFAQLCVVARWNQTPVLSASLNAWMLLGLSGAIGLVIGDTFYFRSLQILGARRCLIVTTTAPIFAVFLAAIFLKEVPGLWNCVGIVTTVFGVGIVVSDRRAQDDAPGLYPGSLKEGVLHGLAASLCQAVGIVLARQAMVNQECSPLEATFIRLIAAVSIFLPIVLGRRQLGQVVREVTKRETIARFLPACICGAWLGIWLSQIAVSSAPAATVQTLLSTSPIFAIPLVWLVHRQTTSKRGWVGSLIAVAGIFLIFS